MAGFCVRKARLYHGLARVSVTTGMMRGALKDEGVVFVLVKFEKGKR